MPQGVWVHIASTWDGTQVTHYVNGSMIAGGAAFSGSLSQTTDILAIGANAGYVTQPNATAFMGAIDDLYLYNRALSAPEIVQVMNGLAIPEPEVVSLLTLGLAVLCAAARRRHVSRTHPRSLLPASEDAGLRR